MRYSVAYVEDHGAVRTGLIRLLEDEGFTVAGSAGTVVRGLALIRETRPDVAVIDLLLPDGSGVDLVRQIGERVPTTSTLLYTASEEPSGLLEALDCGASGFALKAGAPAELFTAIRTVADGGTYFDPRLGARLREARASGTGRLRPREREVLELVAQGRSNDDIASDLVLSPQTVRTHVRNIAQRLGARSRAHAVAIAMSAGEIDVEPAASSE